MARLLLAALALCCFSTFHVGEAGRSLLISDEQAQAAVKSLDQAAGSVLGQLSDAVAGSGVTSSDSRSSLMDKTLQAINEHAPQWKTDLGYFIKPQVASELYNAVNNLGPVHESWMAAAPQAAQGPAAVQTAVAAQPSQSVSTEGRRRRLMQSDSGAYGSSIADYVLAPAASPGPAAAAAFGPLAALDAPEDFGAFSPEGALYTSYAKKKGIKKKAAANTAGTAAAVQQPAAAVAGSGAVSGAQVPKNQHVAAAAPAASSQAASQGTVTGVNRQVTTLAQDLQPKSASSANGVSLDPNRPNALPGPLRLATQQQAAVSGYSTQPTSATAVTDDTAFAGTPTNKLPGPLRIDSTTPFDGPSVSGSEISLILGTRIATPFFGTGFNFCIDRYFGSFPKVGIVIPNPGQWLLPELQDIGRTLQTTLQLPPDATIGHGLTLQPTSDGFLIFLPSVQPNNINDFGVRYGIQIGQAFGYDFGIGVLRDICFISFTTV